MKKPQRVEVTWVDSCSAHGWFNTEERLKWQETECVCFAVGWLVGEDDKHITISINWRENGSTSDVFAIPRACVRKIQILRASARR